MYRSQKTYQAFADVIGVDAGQGQVKQGEDVGAPLGVPPLTVEHGARHSDRTVEAGDETVWLSQGLHRWVCAV